MPDELVAACVDGRPFADRKNAAMRAYPTQIQVDGPFFALSNNLGQEVLGTESTVVLPTMPVTELGRFRIAQRLVELLQELAFLPARSGRR